MHKLSFIALVLIALSMSGNTHAQPVALLYEGCSDCMTSCGSSSSVTFVSGHCTSTSVEVDGSAIPFSYEITCSSPNNSSSPWTAAVYAGQSSCSFTPTAVFAGTGSSSCGGRSISGIAFGMKVNCGNTLPTTATPASTSPPTTLTPTTLTPTTLTPTPTSTPSSSLILQSYEFSFSFFEVPFTSKSFRVESSRKHADALVPALAEMKGVLFHLLTGHNTAVTYSVCNVHGTCTIRDQLACSSNSIVPSDVDGIDESSSNVNVGACGSLLFIPLQQTNVMLQVKAGDQLFAFSVYEQIVS